MTIADEIKQKMHLAAQRYRFCREAELEETKAQAEMDDLLDAIRPAMEANAKRRLEAEIQWAEKLRESEAVQEAELRKYCLTVEARQVLALCHL